MFNYDELKNLKNIVVHGSLFHADDTSCCAFMKMVNPDINILRMNDVSNVNQKESIICDIGKGEFDHHQTDGSVPTIAVSINDSGDTVNTKRCAFGRLWEAYGKDFIKENHKDYKLPEKTIDYVFNYVKERYVKYIDYLDNNGGYKFNHENIKELDFDYIDLKDRSIAFTVFDSVRNFNPNYLEELKGEDRMPNFFKAVELDTQALKYNIGEALLDYNKNVEKVLESHFETIIEKTSSSAFESILETQDFLEKREEAFFENFNIVRDEYNKYKNSDTKVEFKNETLSIGEINKKLDGNAVVVERYVPLNFFNFEQNKDGFFKKTSYDISPEKNTIPTTHFLIFPANRGNGYTLQSATEFTISKENAEKSDCNFWHAGARLASFDTIEDAIKCANLSIIEKAYNQISDDEIKIYYTVSASENAFGFDFCNKEYIFKYIVDSYFHFEKVNLGFKHSVETAFEWCKNHLTSKELVELEPKVNAYNDFIVQIQKEVDKAYDKATLLKKLNDFEQQRTYNKTVFSNNFSIRYFEIKAFEPTISFKISYSTGYFEANMYAKDFNSLSDFSFKQDFLSKVRLYKFFPISDKKEFLSGNFVDAESTFNDNLKFFSKIKEELSDYEIDLTKLVTKIQSFFEKNGLNIKEELEKINSRIEAINNAEKIANDSDLEKKYEQYSEKYDKKVVDAWRDARLSGIDAKINENGKLMLAEVLPSKLKGTEVVLTTNRSYIDNDSKIHFSIKDNSSNNIAKEEIVDIEKFKEKYDDDIFEDIEANTFDKIEN